jgi:hypothetical protein
MFNVLYNSKILAVTLFDVTNGMPLHFGPRTLNRKKLYTEGTVHSDMTGVALEPQVVSNMCKAEHNNGI